MNRPVEKSFLPYVLLGLCLLTCLITGGYAVQYIGGLKEGRTGVQAVIARTPWLISGFQSLARRIDNTFPSEARILLEPSRLDPSGYSLAGRWYLYLNYCEYPLRFFTRNPAAAGGTLMGYRQWIDHHFGQHQTGSAPLTFDQQRAAEERAIEWRLRYPQSTDFTHDDIEICKRSESDWKPVDLAAEKADDSSGAEGVSGLSILSGLLCAVALWLAGHGILALFKPARRRNVFEKNATAFMLGCAVVPFLGVLLVWLAKMPLGPVGSRMLLCASALIGAALALWQYKKQSHADVKRSQTDVANPDQSKSIRFRLGFVLIVLFCAFAFFQTLSTPMHGFDATFHFAYKGKLLYHEGFGTQAWTDLEGPIGRIQTHPGYPLGLPVLTALTSAFRGSFDENCLKALLPFLLIAGAIWIWGALRSRGSGVAMIGSLLWLTLPIFYFSSAPHDNSFLGMLGLTAGGGTVEKLFSESLAWTMPMPSDQLDGAADLPLAVFLMGAFFHLWRTLPSSRMESDRSDPWIAGLLLSGAVLVKNEGLALAAVLGLAFIIAVFISGRVKRTDQKHDSPGPRSINSPSVTLSTSPRPFIALAVSFGPAIIVAVICLLMRINIPTIDEGYFRLMTPSNIADNLDRTPEVLAGFWNAFIDPVRWGLVWIFLCAVVIWSLFKPMRFLQHPAFAAVLTISGGIIVYYLALLVTPWDLSILFTTLIPDRLLVHLAPLAVFAACALAWSGPSKEQVR